MLGLNSDAYLTKLICALKEYQILDNVFFLATDGAKVVSSDQNGLVGKLRQTHIPHFIST